jgi:hypothetical protein
MQKSFMVLMEKCENFFMKMPKYWRDTHDKNIKKINSNL